LGSDPGDARGIGSTRRAPDRLRGRIPQAGPCSTFAGPLFRPSTRSHQGFFVTGTDTGVGKTLVACGLLRAFAARGLTVAGMKPVATGVTPGATGDVEQLVAASNVAAPRKEVNPYSFAPPIAPHIAAEQAGVRIELERIELAFHALAARAQVVVVEGIGGFHVPLGHGADTTQLAARLALPVVLVVGLRLGCLNHALLTVEAIAARGLKLAGWVANHVDPDMAVATENVQALEQRISAPLIARIAHAAIPDSGTIAPRLDLTPLMQYVDVRSAAEREGRALNGRTRSVRTRGIKSARKRPI
jgi:dethiobiotin synthetase